MPPQPPQRPAAKREIRLQWLLARTWSPNYVRGLESLLMDKVNYSENLRTAYRHIRDQKADRRIPKRFMWRGRRQRTGIHE
jgi:hypothetical protein